MKDGWEYKFELRRFLSKLNIKSATLDPMEEMSYYTTRNFGTPDQLIVSPSAYKDYLRAFGDKK